MTWREAPTNCMRHAAANRERTLTIGFVPNENFMRLRMKPTTKPPDVPLSIPHYGK
jgi:hypothetical protein